MDGREVQMDDGTRDLKPGKVNLIGSLYPGVA
jgi:hypothetical protein